MNLKRILLLTSAAGALALGACSGGDDEAATPVTNAGDMTPIEVGNTATAVPTEAPAAPRIDNATSEVETVPTTLSADEQTQDDADATGMTARVARDEGDNEAQPAE